VPREHIPKERAETVESTAAQKAEREQRWLDDNRAAIRAYNVRVAEHGLLSDDLGPR
jgi:post-segregation antitoxin (ccd killing protein)